MQNQVEQLFKSHYRRMYLLAAAYLHDAEAVKDTMADVFAALAEGRLVAGYTCKFFHDALQLDVKANDLFKSNKDRRTIYGLGLSLKKDSYYRTRSLSLTLTYNFNTGKSHYKGTGAGNAEKSRL